MSEDNGIRSIAEVASMYACDEKHFRDVLTREGIKCLRISKSTWIFSLYALGDVLERVEDDGVDVLPDSPYKRNE